MEAGMVLELRTKDALLNGRAFFNLNSPVVAPAKTVINH
jgi:hypothetical protein